MVAVDHDLVVHTLQQPTAKTNLAVYTETECRLKQNSCLC